MGEFDLLQASDRIRTGTDSNAFETPTDNDANNMVEDTSENSAHEPEDNASSEPEEEIQQRAPEESRLPSPCPLSSQFLPMSGAKRIVRFRLLKNTYLFELEIEAGGQTQWKGEEEVQRTDDSLLHDFWDERKGRDTCLKKSGIRSLKYHVFEILDYDFEKTTYKVQWVMNRPINASWEKEEMMLISTSTSKCSECDCALTTENREDHYLEIHHLTRCDCCGKRTPPNELSDHGITHICPICPEGSTDPISDVWHHLELDHGLSPCEDCGGEKVGCHVYVHHYLECSTWRPGQCLLGSTWFPDLDGHLETQHLFCKCPACMLLLDPACLWQHVWDLHELQRCDGICTDDIEHLETQHSWEACKEDRCGRILESRGLDNHLVRVHQWKKCESCSYIGSTQTLLMEHMVWEHHLEECSECEEATLDLARHYETEHGYGKCPFCGVWGSLEYLREHTSECPKKVPCSNCHALQTPSSYNQHRVDKHDWVLCGYCNHLEQNNQLLDLHVQRNHNPEPCPDCGTVLAIRAIDTHRVEAHGYRQCPFCPALSCKLLEHILTTHHRAEDEQQPRSVPSNTTASAKSDNITKSTTEALAQSLATMAGKSRISGTEDVMPLANELVGRGGAVSNSPTIGDDPTSVFTHGRSSPETHASSAQESATVRDCDGTCTIGSDRHDIPKDAVRTLSTSAGGKRAVSPDPETIAKRHQPRRSGKDAVSYAIPPSRKPSRGSLRRTLHKPVGCHVEGLCSPGLRVTRRYVMATGLPIRQRNKIAQLSSISDKFEDRKKGAKLIKEFSLMLMADAMDSSKRSRDRERADEHDQRSVSMQHSLNLNEKTGVKFKNQLQRGRQLVKVCGNFRGVLCFLALNKMGGFLQLAKQGRERDLQRFHECLNQYERQWIAGAGVLDSIEKRSFDGYVIGRGMIQELEEGSSTGPVLDALLPIGQGRISS
ncbi:hypothetical protein PG985_005587 [Apiospora marii]|uniref:uncharacterized protein n=1 Tax=Apiospora marii TaxID=335849 RepID=UPI00312E3A18